MCKIFVSEAAGISTLYLTQTSFTDGACRAFASGISDKQGEIQIQGPSASCQFSCSASAPARQLICPPGWNHLSLNTAFSASACFPLN